MLPYRIICSLFRGGPQEPGRTWQASARQETAVALTAASGCRGLRSRVAAKAWALVS